MYRSGPARNDVGFTAVLVRPEGVVAWVAEKDRDPGAFEQAATRWFAPAQH
ncbi:aromatic-ring hydroxylase C-terminal domain-containing protein [Streptomyces sp. OR43]|uniref:aromatic-ring hydroxylase C-terminal domain-containing protein n=1 Tax=Streptomyces sp. or43 TaxID=2478957 RepID=UPI001651303B|nr:hypothetical protein [Streptomyces sp. or43]